MPTYCIYFVGFDDHFHGTENIECATDDEAVACALDQIGEFPAVEVWRGTQPVGRIGTDGEGWPN